MNMKRKRVSVNSIQSRRKKPRLGPVESISAKVALKKRRINTTEERKYLDVQTQVQTTSTTASINVVNGVASGENGWNRDGREIQNLSLELTAYYAPAAASNDLYFARAMVVWDAAPGGTLPGISRILQMVDNAGTTTTDPLALPNQDNKKRFTILRDHRVLLPTSNTIAAGGFEVNANPSSNNELVWKWHIPLKGIVTEFTGTGAVIANITQGALYFIHFNQDSSLISDWNIIWSSRLKYLP